jgi:hypothetical protein
VANFQLCKSMDRVAATVYFAEAKKAGKAASKPTATPACADPGPFVYTPPAPHRRRQPHRPRLHPQPLLPRSRSRRRRPCVVPLKSAACRRTCQRCLAAGAGGTAADRRRAATLLREIEILDEYGDRRQIHIPAERR